MLFSNPVKGTIHPTTWTRPSGNTEFKVTQIFGPSSLTAEPSYSWPGGEGITAGYYSHFHRGLDMGNRSCGSDILAAAPGKAIYVGTRPSGANAIVIDHGGGWQTYYWHLSGFAIKQGVTVKAGQLIGYVGNTGNSTACHLHFQVMTGCTSTLWSGKPVDPWRRLKQNVHIQPTGPGVNIRASAGSGTTLGAAYAITANDGYIYLAGTTTNPLGATNVWRSWAGTVVGATYTVNGISGNTWEKMYVGGDWRYIATPLTMLSQS